MVRTAVLLSRKQKGRPFMFTGEEYVDMVKATVKAKEKGNKNIVSFYETLTNGPLDATLDIYEFKQSLPEGYIIDLLRFNREGDLITVDEGLKLPKEGWQTAIGSLGIALETSQKEAYVNLGDAVLDGKIKGYLSIRNKPEKGEQRIVLRGPDWGGGGLLYAHVYGGRSCSHGSVGALRRRNETAEDYDAEILERKSELERLNEGLAGIKSLIRDAERKAKSLAY
jgi:hypothetical protein